MQSDDPDLASLDAFLRAAMPAAVRKLRAWQGLSPIHHHDLVADLQQEVAADFIAHRAALEAMPKDERHERWLRLVGRSHYRLRGREARAIDSSARLDEIAIDADGAAEAITDATREAVPALPRSEAEFAETLIQHGVHLKNGRLNEYITARSIGLSKRQLRVRGQRLVAALRADRVVEFWRRRLVESLIGLAADVLRDRAQVVILGEPSRVRPDPTARLRRIQRIRDRLRYLPAPAELRRVLARYGRKCRDPLDPERALQAAAALDPSTPFVPLWSFELAIVRGDAARAAAAIAAARRCGGDRISIVLARARLLEVRGRIEAARLLLSRARQRRDDVRLRICAARLRSDVRGTG